MTFNFYHALTMLLAGAIVIKVAEVADLIKRPWVFFWIGVLIGILTVLCGIKG
jgi:hypothetical protein